MATFNGTADEFVEKLQKLLAALTGDGNEYVAQAQRILTRIGNATLKAITEDFDTKSAGGTGRDGEQWDALALITKAKRLIAQYKKQNPDTVGLLTEEQTATLNEALQGTEAGTASRAAASKKAWALLKSMGARIAIEEALGADMPILIESGDMRKSLEPGEGDQPAAANGQVFEVGSGSVAVGTTQKPWHQTGTATMPARRLWPEDGDIPEAWLNDIAMALAEGIEAEIGTL